MIKITSLTAYGYRFIETFAAKAAPTWGALNLVARPSKSFTAKAVPTWETLNLVARISKSFAAKAAPTSPPNIQGTDFTQYFPS